MDWPTAIEWPGVFDTISRGSLTAWPAGGVGLIGDSLGPIMHAHDDASEIFYFLSGRCRLEDCPVDDGGLHDMTGPLVQTPRITVECGG